MIHAIDINNTIIKKKTKKMNNTLNKYGFEKEFPLKEKNKIVKVEYPNDITNDEFNLKDFNQYNIDTDMPLVNPIYYYNIDNNFKGNVTIENNCAPEKPIVIEQEVTVNLNNKKIIAPIFAEKSGAITEGNTDSYGFWIKKGGNLTIEGNGEVIAQDAKYSMAVWANGGNVIIKSGIFKNNGEGSDLIYASDGSTIEIYGGEFHPCKMGEGVDGTKNEYSALNIKDKDRDNTKIIVYGGRFYNFNPADNKSEGKNTNFVAEGYESILVDEKQNIWEVQKK
jgi:hypothetical protein